MPYEELKERVCRANLALVEAGLMVLTWGNVSGADRAAWLMAIKPGGVAYSCLCGGDMVVLRKHGPVAHYGQPDKKGSA